MRVPRLVPALAAAVVLAGLPANAAAAPAPRPTERPHPLAPRVHRPTGRLQVRFANGVTARGRQAALDRLARRGHTVRVDTRVPSLNAVVVRAGRAAAALLRDDPAVAYVEPESRYAAHTAEPTPNEHVEIGVDTVQAAGNTGAGAIIAVLDSPVDSANPDLDGSGKVASGGNFATDVPEDPDDPYLTKDFACSAAACPHGTAVATVAAAEAGDGHMVGVAPGARIRSYGVFRRFVYTDPDTGAKTEETGASSADLANALSAVATYAASHPALVAVNMSLGGPFDNRLLRDAIADLHDSAPRLSVVVSAGNDSSERANFPAGDPYVISVGASGQTPTSSTCPTTKPPASAPWTVASFSNTGDVDVVAPGRCVSAWYPLVASNGAARAGTSAVRNVDGTSFAAPMVAGVAALLSTATTPSVGDAARAAIVTTSPTLDAPEALDVADGPEPYTAAFADRGWRLAERVGRRSVELLRVDPASATAPAPAALVPVGGCTPTGCGTFGSPTSTTRGNVATTRLAYAAPVPASGTYEGTGYDLLAGPGPGHDVMTVPVDLLHAIDSFEGLPVASGGGIAHPLTYGSRSAGVVSAAIPNGTRLDYAFSCPCAEYDPAAAEKADVYLWEPASTGGVADAASEPTWQGGFDSFSTKGATNHVTVGTRTDPCEYVGGPPEDYTSYRACRSGRYLVGWLLYSDDDTSSSAYRLTARFGPRLTVTAPVTLSSVATAPGPFTVTWKATNAGTAHYDVEYGVPVKNANGDWVVATWQPWLTGTTRTSASFGSGGLPLTPRAGRTYHFRVTARDAYGNAAIVRSFTMVPVDDWEGPRYTPSWEAVAAPGRWRSRAHRSVIAGATATFTYDARQLRVIGDRCAACGQLKVYVNGAYVRTVDTYSSTTRTRQVLYTTTQHFAAPPTLRIVLVGTTGRPKVVLDAVAALR
jgi:subtilisin family serine protease